MPALANLYIRTPQGRVTAFNPATVLPARLKTLLKAVDGKTSTAALEAAHAALGEVASLLAMLLDYGLIADKNAVATFASVPPALADTPPWVNSDNALLDSSFSDFGTSVFGQLPSPQSKKSE